MSLCPLFLIYVFFLPLRPQQRPTLFPYTTLFRSWTIQHDKHTAMQLVGSATIPAGAVLDTRELADDPTFQQRGIRQTMKQDRKSTRLNSSHLGISYAVFCLKKKKKKKTHTTMRHE